LKTISQHFFILFFSNNVIVHFTFVEVKETLFGENWALNNWITPPSPQPHQHYFVFFLWWNFFKNW